MMLHQKDQQPFPGFVSGIQSDTQRIIQFFLPYFRIDTQIHILIDITELVYPQIDLIFGALLL